jgi:hypothetical protein
VNGVALLFADGVVTTRRAGRLQPGPASRSGRPCTGSILAYDVPEQAAHGKVEARVVIDGRPEAPPGSAIGPDGDPYFA